MAVGLSAGYSARELRDEVMDSMISNTFKNKRSTVMNWFKPAYDETNLENEIRKHIYPKMGWKPGDKEPTLADLAKQNPKLRTCITAIKYDFDEKKGGPSFTPRIFDTENPYDQDKLVLKVARATSAAPVYFAPSKIQDGADGKPAEFADGGVFANNPAGWGFALAALHVKAENVRVISVGTGYLDYELKAQVEAEEESEKGWFSKMWNKTKGYFGSMKDYLLEVV